jgi:branched-chain amino acid transport system substrate-binding protein
VSFRIRSSQKWGLQGSANFGFGTLRQAANLKNFELGLLLPGIVINTGPADYYPIEQMQMSRFNGEHGELFGSAITGEIGTQ